jgi:hypothetical protein
MFKKFDFRSCFIIPLFYPAPSPCKIITNCDTKTYEVQWILKERLAGQAPEGCLHKVIDPGLRKRPELLALIRKIRGG